MTLKPMHIIIAGGKTGGHLFPGISVADALKRMMKNAGRQIEILFVGTDAEFETRTLEKYHYDHKAIYAKPIKGKNILLKGLSVAAILISLVQSMVIMKTFKPDFVLGVGGFSSFAVIVSAWLLGIPTAIQEQNAFPGMTNRLLSRFAKTIFTAFEQTRGWENRLNAKYVGNPVRKAAPSSHPDDSSLENLDPGKPTILITGGSQGASSINHAVLDALELMDEGELTPDSFNIIHQTGISEQEMMKSRYEKLHISATVGAFFDDMPAFQTIADLVITRAGAGIIAELSTKGLPAILVPYPHAADDHQAFNAKALEQKNAAVMIPDKDLTGLRLKEELTHLMTDPSILTRMKAQLKEFAMPDADEKIASHILKTVKMKE